MPPPGVQLPDLIKRIPPASPFEGDEADFLFPIKLPPAGTGFDLPR